MRPIIPGDFGELVAVQSFLTDQLKLDSGFLRSMGSLEVRRVPFGPSARIKNEVIVVFNSVDTQNVVKGAAKNLAGMGPDYGVRLEPPNHLKTAMSALQSVSYKIKQRYTTAGRNVLFDDGLMDLVLDFSIGEDKPWRRMTSQQAIDRKRKTAEKTGKFNLEAQEIDELLDGRISDGGHSEADPWDRWDRGANEDQDLLSDNGSTICQLDGCDDDFLDEIEESDNDNKDGTHISVINTNACSLSVPKLIPWSIASRSSM